jgi:hypothetical protein
MQSPTTAAAPPSRLAAFRTATRERTIPSACEQARAYSATVFVGAWNASGVSVPSTREQDDTANRGAGCP